MEGLATSATTTERGGRKAQARHSDQKCEVDDIVSDALKSVVENDILPSLNLLHKSPPPARPNARRPTQQEIDRFHALLLAPDPVDLDIQLAALLGSDMPLETLLLDLLTPAARHLGTLWEEDACDFFTVTVGLSRLHIITHNLCARQETSVRSVGRSVLLLPAPRETHVYGLTVVASFFRRAGWSVTILDRAIPDGLALLRQMHFDVIGLSLACDVYLPAVKETVESLRSASCNAALAVIVGGPWFSRHEVEAHTVSADACVLDGQAAPRVAEALLGSRHAGKRAADPNDLA